METKVRDLSKLSYMRPGRESMVAEERSDLEVRVDFFKESGKWAYGGNVNIGSVRMWQGDRKYEQAIVNNQEIIHDGWQDREYYTVVVRDTDENWSLKEYSGFNHMVIHPHKFRGLKRETK